MFLYPNTIFRIYFQKFINFIYKVIFKIKKKFVVRRVDIINGDSFFNIVKNKNKIKINNCLLNKKNFILNKIKNSILIFHNTDEAFNDVIYKKIKKFKPKKCFTTNLVINKKNFYNIPIGLENYKYYKHYDGHDDLFNKSLKIKEKIDGIIYGFNVDTNQNREIYLNKLKKYKNCYHTFGWNIKTYRNIVSKYKFIFCPQGKGFDTHRIWEAMYLKTIPILIKDKFNIFYKKERLPVLIVNNIDKIGSLKKKDLNTLYLKIAVEFDSEKLKFDFWKNKILNSL
jgi:hypothetical protein